jgi:hypothetical protein
MDRKIVEIKYLYGTVSLLNGCGVGGGPEHYLNDLVNQHLKDGFELYGKPEIQKNGYAVNGTQMVVKYEK